VAFACARKKRKKWAVTLGINEQSIAHVGERRKGRKEKFFLDFIEFGKGGKKELTSAGPEVKEIWTGNKRGGRKV